MDLILVRDLVLIVVILIVLCSEILGDKQIKKLQKEIDELKKK